MSRYQGMVLSGRAYTANSGSIAVGTTIAATAIPLALYNPIGSGVNLVIWKVSFAYSSGTWAGGGVFLCANTNTAAAVTTGTAATTTVNFLGNVMGYAAKGSALTNASTGGAVVPTVLRPLWAVNQFLNTTATNPEVTDIDLGGEYVVAPGATVSFGTILGASTSSPTGFFGITWAEIPLA